MKQRFFQKPLETLVKAIHPWEKLSVDFKGPLPSKNKYVPFIVDEFSRFLFAFAMKGTSSSTVITCLSTLFYIFRLPVYVHIDRGLSYISEELKQYLNDRGEAISRSTPYHPSGNAL